jgi:hypothetical protein
MNPATLSLCALLAVIFLSLTSRINVGILAVALAFPVGIYSAGWKPDAVLGLFPSSLFLTLAGVTLLFGIAQINGTLGVLARRGVRLCTEEAPAALAHFVSNAGKFVYLLNSIRFNNIIINYII